MTGSKPSWQPTADARRTKINNAIPTSHRLPPGFLECLTDARNVITIPDCCGVLTQQEIEITSISSATKLLEDIRNRVFTAVEVTTAFCKRASIAHQLVCTYPYQAPNKTTLGSLSCTRDLLTANFHTNVVTRPTVSLKSCTILL